MAVDPRLATPVADVVYAKAAEELNGAGYLTMGDIANHGAIPTVRGVGDVSRQKLERWFTDNRMPLTPPPAAPGRQMGFPTTEEEVRELASRGGKAVHATSEAHELESLDSPEAFDIEKLGDVRTLLRAAQLMCVLRGLRPDDTSYTVWSLIDAVLGYFPKASDERKTLNVLCHAALVEIGNNNDFDPDDVESSLRLFSDYLELKYGSA
jgi:hypothetical protein